MSSGKMSGRQKMINMMYLVLIALLALNVSKEIIKAFNLMENSLNTSTANLVAKNDMALKAIQAEADKPDAKAAAKLVEDAKKIADDFVNQINNVKADLEASTEGRKQDPESMLVKGGLAELTMGDNMEVHSNYFLLEKGSVRLDGKSFAFNPGGGKMRGDAVKDLINKTRLQLLGVLDAASKNQYLGGRDDQGYTKKLLLQFRDELSKKTSLIAEDSKDKEGHGGWVNMYLEHSPLAGVFALLSKYQNDARALESEITTKLAESVNASKIKFDKTMAVISTPSSAVLQGQTYEADLILAAYDSKSDLKITVGGAAVEVVDGVGKYKTTGSSAGEHEYTVQIAVPKPGGGFEMKEAKGKYTVFPPIAAISADELNVFYVGLDNPISVAVAGIDDRNVVVTCNGANLVKTGAGKYKALIPVRKGNEAMISVSAKVGDRNVSMGSKKFRIRNVPKPVFRAGSLAFDKPVSLAALKVQGAAVALMDGFVYDGVKFTIQSFKFIAVTRTGPKQVPVTGASLANIKGILNTMKAGEFVMFTEIRAVGPGGTAVYLENASAPLI